MELNLQNGAVLLLIAAVVAMITRRFRMPYSVGLVLAGAAMSQLPFAPQVTLTKELIFTVFLPPLLFESAFALPFPQLKKDFAVITVLATLGVILAATATTLGMHYIAGWHWMAALVFGVLIAATDPVSVIATFKEAKAHGRLMVLIESESLLNDGTAAVAFGVAVTLASGRMLSPQEITMTLLQTIGGGVLCGAVIGAGALLLAGKTDDHLVEITVTTVAAYGSFLLADRLGLSGVLATITAGLLMGNFKALGQISPRGKQEVCAFWEYAAFVANSMIFLLIGMRTAHESLRQILIPAGLAIVLVTVGRAVSIYPCCWIFAASSLRVPSKQQHVLFWGGLRGALALALSLGLPAEVPQRREILSVSFAVVGFSVLVQGLTIRPFLRRMGEIE